MPIFSLIICTYQRSQALVTLLKSVQKQRLYPDEILVIDGSIDNQTENVLIKEVIKNLKYFKVEKQDRGLTRQRNFGIEKLNFGIENWIIW